MAMRFISKYFHGATGGGGCHLEFDATQGSGEKPVGPDVMFVGHEGLDTFRFQPPACNMCLNGVGVTGDSDQHRDVAGSWPAYLTAACGMVTGATGVAALMARRGAER